MTRCGRQIKRNSKPQTRTRENGEQTAGRAKASEIATGLAAAAKLKPGRRRSRAPQKQAPHTLPVPARPYVCVPP